jgi:hypothetical protein
MIGLLRFALGILASPFKSKSRLEAENAVFRHQLIGNQGIGNLYRIYSATKRDGIDFNLASIPSDFSDTSDEAFDQKYMIALFDRGYNLASHSSSAMVTGPAKNLPHSGEPLHSFLLSPFPPWTPGASIRGRPGSELVHGRLQIIA